MANITVSWNAAPASDNVTAFQIWGANGTGTAFGSCTLLATVSGLTWTDTGLPNNQARTYYIVAVNQIGSSSPEGPINVTTAAPSSIYLLTANNLSDLPNPATARANLGLAAYILSFFFTTTPAASEVLFIHVAGAPFAIPANFSGALQSAVGTNPTASFALDVQKNGASIGTITVSTGGIVTATTTSGTSKSIAVGDVLKIVAPGTADATAASMAFSMIGTR
jgi:hypothetical protein